jgi:ribosome-associated translation inhibitor RaiA
LALWLWNDNRAATPVRVDRKNWSSFMQIQINSDDNVSTNEEMRRDIEAEIEKTLGRFSDQITRVELHLGDANADKPGDNDKRCAVEARLAGMQPEAATHHAASLEEAYRGAVKKLRRSLDRTVGRLHALCSRT